LPAAWLVIFHKQSIYLIRTIKIKQVGRHWEIHANINGKKYETKYVWTMETLKACIEEIITNAEKQEMPGKF